MLSQEPSLGVLVGLPGLIQAIGWVRLLGRHGRAHPKVPLTCVLLTLPGGPSNMRRLNESVARHATMATMAVSSVAGHPRPASEENAWKSGSGIAGRYAWLWLLGIAVGWFEATVVIYLRELYYPNGFHFPVVLLPQRLALVEILREAASILLLMAGGRLAGRFFLERFAAFMLLFGIWDLVYYVVLKLALGWPEAWTTWDILFLIPVPWVGPVRAPIVVSLSLVATGTYLYWTSERPRFHGRAHWVLAVVAGLVVIASFVAEWRVVIEQRVPQSFPAWLFWIGVGLGWAVFLTAERWSMKARRNA